MAFWPFSRKKRKTDILEKEGRTTKQKVMDSSRSDPGRSTIEVNASKLRRKSGPRGSQRKRSFSAVSSKSQPSRPRDSDRPETVPPVPLLPQASPNQFNEKIPVPQGPSRQVLGEVPINREDIPSYYFQNPLSQSSIQPEKFDVGSGTPTLQVKRSARDSNLPRRKSSKRKAEDHAREQEIRAMSSPIPIPKRPQSHTSGLLARESRKVPGGLNRNLERPTSEVSLPLPESIHSTRSRTSDMRSFKISTFDALSPRPTIKYAENPRSVAGSSIGPSRASTRKERVPAIPEGNFNSRERIEDLADDFDASELRDLLERDHRRREKKRASDHAKLERRLQRRSEKQRVDDGPGKTLDESNNGGGDEVGLGIGGQLTIPKIENPAVGPSRNDTKSPESWLEDPSRDPSQEHTRPRDPFLDPEPETHYEEATPPDEKDDPILETAKAVRLSTASISAIAAAEMQQSSPQETPIMVNISNTTSRSTQQVPENVPAEITSRSPDSNNRLAGSWTSFFRRSGTKNKRASTDRGREKATEFTNVSRDSLGRGSVPPPIPPKNVTARSGTPQRTQSKFREDLPELPTSSPDSRVQSPEFQGPSPYIDRDSKVLNLDTEGSGDGPRLSDVHPAYREEALNKIQSLQAPSPEPQSALLSQSLASVDSEGSWLSGRPSKRSSQQINPLRGSAGSLKQHLHEGGEGESTYFARQTPTPAQARVPGGLTSQLNQRNAAAAAENSDDEESINPSEQTPDESVKVNTVVGRRPTIVNRGQRAKSREGLLDDFQAGNGSADASPVGESPMDPPAESPGEGSSIHRATSVNIAKNAHVRQISAGSAKLLDFSPRTSGEQKRSSLIAPPERSPLRSSEAAEEGS